MARGCGQCDAPHHSPPPIDRIANHAREMPRAAVTAGETVNFTATPIFRGGPLAAGITITAEGSGGFNPALTILNVSY